MQSIRARKLRPGSAFHLGYKAGVDFFPLARFNLSDGAGDSQVLESQTIAPDVLGLQHKEAYDIRVESTNSLNAAAFGTYGQYVEFKMEQESDQHLIEDVYARITIQNTTGAPIQLLPAQMWFDTVQVYANNSSNRIMQMDGFHWYIMDNMNRAIDELVMDAPVENTTSAWAAAGALAAGASRTVYLKCPNPYKYGDFYAGWLKNTVYRFVYAGATNSTITASVPGDIVVSQFQVIVRHREISPEESLMLEAKQRAGPIRYRFVSTATERQSQTWNNGTTYTLKLQGIKGLAVSAWYIFRSSLVAAASGAITYSSIVDEFEVEDSVGRSLKH